MINPRNKEDFNALVKAVKESKRKMQPFREKRRRLYDLFVGSEYSDEGEAKKVYLNLISLATNVYVRQCAVRAPSARITSPYDELRPKAKELSLACKMAADETRFGQALRRSVTEALFAPMAVVKVGLTYAGQEDVYGEAVDITEPYINMVSFDDYVRDMSARSAYHPAFEGDTYYLTIEELKEKYPKAMAKLDVSTDELSMQSDSGDDRVESLAHTVNSGEDNFRKKVAVQDVWLTKERVLVTYLLNNPKFALDVVEFDVPDEGPYHSLWFTDVPDNAMPLPPFSVLKNIQDLANSLFRRLANQAKIQKRVVGFSDEDSAKRFSTAHDGDGVYWDGQKPENIEAGGIDQRTLALLIQVKDIFSWASGNLDSLGGLSAMSETASQDEMIAKSANAQIADMQDATSDFAKKIFGQLAWYEWTDPVRNRILQKELPGGVGMSLAVEWTPETRHGDFLDFNFDIIPMSMREDNPAQKIQKIQAALMNIFLPLQPFMQQQGLTLDAKRLTSLVADYSNMPELEQLIVAMNPEAGQQQGPIGNPNPTTKPAQTKRTYERINRPGATRVGKDMALVQTLMGGNVQEAEAAAIGRSVS